MGSTYQRCYAVCHELSHDAAKILASTDASKYEPRCRRRQGANFWSSVAVRQKM